MIHSQTEKNQINATQEQLINALLIWCEQNGAAMAAWRLPEQSAIEIIIDHSDNFIMPETSLEELEPGFIFSPFDKNKKKYFIKSERQIKIENDAFDIEDEALLEELKPIIDKVKKVQGNKNKTIQIETASPQAFQDLVKLAVQHIKQEQFHKVVPSRKKKIVLPDNFSIADLFLRLKKTYESSFLSLVYTPETNLWIGATPEILINTSGNHFKTVALAGTQAYDPDKDLTDIAWTQKEIEEQAFVSRYIINCFKKIRLREFSEKGPKTVLAGNLIHLKTEFSVDMAATNFPQLGSVMLELLHPTSAVCGMPLESAYDFIKKHEPHDRKFFSGYLGPVNQNNETAIFVNLRCMEIKGSSASLYAGAGVTESSVPEKEWKETEIKMNTLLNVIKS